MAKATTPTTGSGPAPSPITCRTPFVECGERATRLATQCSYDIEPLANMLIRMAEQHAGDLGAEELPAVLRMLGCRIKELNSVLMSYLTDDRISMGDVHEALYRDGIAFDATEVNHG